MGRFKAEKFTCRVKIKRKSHKSKIQPPVEAYKKMLKDLNLCLSPAPQLHFQLFII